MVRKYGRKSADPFGLQVSCEGFGLLNAINCLSQLNGYLELKGKRLPEKVMIYCDNKSIIDTINKLKGRKLTLKQLYIPEINVILEILEEMKQIRGKQVQLVLKHIKGHQDRKMEKLSHPAEMNVEADHLATKSLEERNEFEIKLKATKAKIVMNKKHITSKISIELRNAFHSIQLREYMQTSNGWNDRTIENIWWQVHGPVMAQYPIGNQSTLLKFIHNRSPCNKRENLYYGYVEPYCRCCENIIETPEHILQCNKCVK
jgi:hypothetical protein